MASRWVPVDKTSIDLPSLPLKRIWFAKGIIFSATTRITPMMRTRFYDDDKMTILFRIVFRYRSAHKIIYCRLYCTYMCALNVCVCERTCIIKLLKAKVCTCVWEFFYPSIVELCWREGMKKWKAILCITVYSRRRRLRRRSTAI